MQTTKLLAMLSPPVPPSLALSQAQILSSAPYSQHTLGLCPSLNVSDRFNPSQHVVMSDTNTPAPDVVLTCQHQQYQRCREICSSETVFTEARQWAFVHTVMRRLTTGIRYEKCVVRRFRRRANVIEYVHKPRQYSIAYCTPRLYGIAYCS
jgi:hypothetical protein